MYEAVKNVAMDLTFAWKFPIEVDRPFSQDPDLSSRLAIFQYDDISSI